MAEAPDGPDRRVRRRRWLGFGLLAVILAGVAAALIANAVNSSTSSAGSPSAQVACNVTTVADEVLPSVVTIQATGSTGSTGGGTGSGEVIRSDGYIVTNNHVISAAASGGSVRVLFLDGKSEPATIVGRDPLTDLAVLKVEPGPELKVIGLGSSDSLRIGQPVVALGSPLGLTGTVTAGIVSALDRTVQVPGENDRSALLVSAVQTDAAINPGNSGGALTNCDGKLIGVPTAGAAVPSPSGGAGGSIGLGFAIPVDLVTQIADELISTGRVSHAYFGLQTVPLPRAQAAQAGVSEGLLVTALAPGGPAAAAGLAPGDVITSIDGQPAESNVQLETLTVTKRAGDSVPVEYERDGQSKQATITLGTQP